MTSILVVTGLYCVGLWLLFRQWVTGRGSPQFMLAVFPTALLFVTVPIPLAVRELILGFQRIAEQGAGGVAVVAPFCLRIARGLRFGAAGFLIAVGIAGALHAFTVRASPRSPQTAEEPDASGRTWRSVIIVTSTLLIVPVGFLSHLTREIPRLVMRAAIPGYHLPGLTVEETMQQMSGTIATQSVLIVLGGIALTIIVTAFAIANLVAARSTTALDSLTRYSWAVLVGAGIWAMWTVVQLSADINSFQLALR